MKGWNIHRRCTRKHFTLSNGQHMGIYIMEKKFRVMNDADPNYNFTAWEVGLCIANTRRQCNDWYERSEKNKRGKMVINRQTGNCGLEGMRIAYNVVKDLQKSVDSNDIISIRWCNDKRKRAYAYLKRLGFILTNWDDKPCYYYNRNYMEGN